MADEHPLKAYQRQFQSSLGKKSEREGIPRNKVLQWKKEWLISSREEPEDSEEVDVVDNGIHVEVNNSEEDMDDDQGFAALVDGDRGDASLVDEDVREPPHRCMPAWMPGLWPRHPLLYIPFRARN